MALANARRFAEIEARVNVDPVTGGPNRRGYEIELGREVARAERAGRPLSVVLVGVDGRAPTRTTEGAGIAEVARLVARITRGTDITCRRGEQELAILLPGTAESGAAVLTTRLESEAKRTHAAGTPTVFGLVEREPNETPQALDTRIDRSLGRPRSATVSALDEVRNASTAVASTLRSSLASTAESSACRRRTSSGAMPSTRWSASSRRRAGSGARSPSSHWRSTGWTTCPSVDGREEADATLGRLAGRFDRSLGSGSVHRLTATAFALVLPGSSIHESEALVDALQSSLEPPHDETGLVLSAGITELVEGEDAEAGLSRAEHALWQAAQAGSGTVVVAVPNKRPVPPDVAGCVHAAEYICEGGTSIEVASPVCVSTRRSSSG